MNQMETDFENKIINNLENYKLTRPGFFSNISWKIILVIGLIFLAIIVFLLMIFRSFLTNNINDDLFLNILDIVYVLLIVNICIAIFTITNYYYRISKIGIVGPTGLNGTSGDRGLDTKCNIFKKRINTFKHETIPNNLKQRIKLNYIPPPQESYEIEQNKWHLCINNTVNEHKPSQIQHSPGLYNKTLTHSRCLKNSTCLKASNYKPPNNKPINGCIVNVDTENQIIHAIQFTYGDNTKLVGMNNTCSSITTPFKNKKDKLENYDKYIVDIKNSPPQHFTKQQLDTSYTPHSSSSGGILNYICNSTLFYKQYNIEYITFKAVDNNKYKLYGTAVNRDGKIVFKENYSPTHLCQSCGFNDDHQKFYNNCSNNNSLDKCINNNCIWKDNSANQCNIYNDKKQCINNSNICKYDDKTETCNGISKCEGESIGNYNLPFTEISSFKAPAGSAIYKIETFNTLDDGIKPGILKGIKFYCRDIITSEDVFIQDENGNKNYYISFGYDLDKTTSQFSNISLNSFTAPISITPTIKKDKIKYYPSFISSTSVLYNNLNIVGIEINSCVYYKSK